MRTIKFRAWDKKEKLFVDAAGLAISAFGEPMEFGNGDCHFNMDDLVVMQFTGLLDKNGKEIYEGDIIKRWRSAWYGDTGTVLEDTIEENKDTKMSGRRRFFPVEWREETTGFYPFTECSTACWDGEIIPNKEVEVIGNIYEHPDLLSKD